jgi:hypothetical protein
MTDLLTADLKDFSNELILVILKKLPEIDLGNDLSISITLGANPILLGVPFLVSLIVAVEVIQSTSL